jgi:hypothetical protein
VILAKQPDIDRRRWFHFGYRFSLRTLMTLVTVAAIGTWGYLEGWPRLVVYWQERQFESGARQLKVGSVPLTGMQLVPGKNPVSTTYTSNGEGRLIGMTKYVWPNAVYCIYYVFPGGYSGGMMQAPCESVEVFRLPPVPLGYMARTEAGRERAHQDDGKSGGEAAQMEAYLTDFLTVISSDRQDKHGLQYELIHADPPAKAINQP